MARALRPHARGQKRTIAAIAAVARMGASPLRDTPSPARFPGRRARRAAAVGNNRSRDLSASESRLRAARRRFVLLLDRMAASGSRRRPAMPLGRSRGSRAVARPRGAALPKGCLVAWCIAMPSWVFMAVLALLYPPAGAHRLATLNADTRAVSPGFAPQIGSHHRWGPHRAPHAHPGTGRHYSCSCLLALRRSAPRSRPRPSGPPRWGS